MKPRNVIWIVVVVAVVAGLGWVLLRGKDSNREYNWQRTLKLEEREPYDLNVFYKAIKMQWGNEFNEIPEKASLEKYRSNVGANSNGIYFFAGKNIYLTQIEIEFLEHFVNDGGTVFISSNGIPNEFIRNFEELKNYYQETYFADSAKAFFRNPFLAQKQFNFPYKVKDHTESAAWSCFAGMNGRADAMEEELVFENAVAKITTTDTAADAPTDFLCVYHGEGRLYLHANPVFFSNYYLKNGAGIKYLAQVLKHLPNEPLWYDLSGAIRKPDSKTGNTYRPIYDFIRSEKSLKYAWWILVIGMSVFLLYGGRRRQRPIPVLARPGNNTLSLVESIGYFYLKEKSNATVFRREWNQFLAFVRYNVRIQLTELNEENARILSERSGVSLGTVEEIFAMYAKYSIFSELTTDELLQVAQKINKFYQEYKNKYGKQSIGTGAAQPA